MTWQYKDAKCECGANLEGVEPIRPRLNVTDVLSTANCPECWRTPEIVEVGEEETEAEPEAEAEAEAETESEAETETETESEAETETETETESEAEAEKESD